MTASLAGNDDILFGPYRTTREAVVAARPDLTGGMPLEVCLTYDGWKILPLKVYRPLAFYAAFGDDEIFECLRVAVTSLLKIGRWAHDIAVLTRSEDVAKLHAALARLDIADRTHVVTVRGDNTLDWCLARYRIDAADIFATHQPLLYLDVDVLCDAPIEGFFRRLIRSGGIEVLPEGLLGEGDPNSSGHWFGWRLMAEDGLTFDPLEPGFSSGTLGFLNKRVAEQAFRAILRSAYLHAAQVGNRRYFEGYDQPFANYILKKLRLVSGNLMPGVINSCRVDPDRSPLPIPATRKGLVHFNGMVGDAAPKRRAMEHYLSMLYARTS